MNALQQRRVGLTLVELLVAISIIAILAALLLGVAAQAGEVARTSRTKSLVTRLHTLVIARYGEYRTRRVEPLPYVPGNTYRARLQALGGFLGVAPNQMVLGDPRIDAVTRLAALREMMCVEMPDRWTDVVRFARFDAGELEDPNRPFGFLRQAPPLCRTYIRRYNELVNAGATPEALRQNQSAEMLYLLVINGTGDGEARTLFNETDVDDTDNDGALEFVDGWGQPIGFLRWAPGFDSDAQLSVAALQRRFGRSDDGGAGGVFEEILTDHDPLDVFRIDNPATDLDPFNATNDALTARGWRLVPLIYSIGSDGEAGIETGADSLVSTPNPWVDADPAVSDIQRLGQLAGDPEAYADNIHNHSVATLSRR